jgi:hypothetical protein
MNVIYPIPGQESGVSNVIYPVPELVNKTDAIHHRFLSPETERIISRNSSSEKTYRKEK